MKPRIRVCIHKTCCQQGSEKIYTALKDSLTDSEADIVCSGDCFRFCKSGPNISVNGSILHHVSPANAASKVHDALTRKTVKKEALGTRPLDELDDVLEDLFGV